MALTMFLEKEGLRRLDETTMKVQLTRVIDRVLAGKRGNIWSFAGPIKIEEVERSSGICYRVKLRFRRIGRTAPAEVLARQWEYMVKIAADAGRGKGWHPVDGFDGDEDKLQDEEPTNGKANGRHDKEFAAIELPTEIKPWFQHLFERDAQISIVQSAINAYKQSNYDDRYHCCLWGDPGSGKSEILLSFERMIGKDSVLRFNATSTSKAGAEKTLLEAEYLPPIMIIEEVEKTEEKALRWLLDVLDHRAEIRKVNFRGSDYRSVKLLCLATVNNRPLFDNMLEGALSSRFAHKIKCPRPSRKALEMILRREVLRVDGDPAWIDPALNWCLDEEGVNDPRRVIAVCMCGRDKLLSGEYQEYLRQTTGELDDTQVSNNEQRPNAHETQRLSAHGNRAR